MKKKVQTMSRNKAFVRVCLVLSGMVATYVILSEVHFTRECHRFCTSDDNPECHLRRTAVLVYDQDVSAHEMSFSQNTHPRISLIDYASEVTSGQYFSINCPVDHYWPRVSTLDRRNSCAVVGNSGILSDSNCGRVIDKHDFIIRANIAPIVGYTSDVGERSHLTILNFETLFYLHRNLTLLTPDTYWHREYVDRVRYLNDSIVWYSKSTVQRNSSHLLKDVAHVLKGYYHLPVQLAYSWRPVSFERFHGLTHYATTGFNAVIIAKTFCNHVTLYGFYPSDTAENGLRINHHYYEDVEFDYVSNVHNFKQEYIKLQEWEDTGEISIVKDLCPGGRRRKLNENVKIDAMMDTRFAFNLNADKLKEILHISEDNDENQSKDKKVLQKVVGPTKKQEMNLEKDFGEVQNGEKAAGYDAKNAGKNVQIANDGVNIADGGDHIVSNGVNLANRGSQIAGGSIKQTFSSDKIGEMDVKFVNDGFLRGDHGHGVEAKVDVLTALRNANKEDLDSGAMKNVAQIKAP